MGRNYGIIIKSWFWHKNFASNLFYFSKVLLQKSTLIFFLSFFLILHDNFLFFFILWEKNLQFSSSLSIFYHAAIVMESFLPLGKFFCQFFSLQLFFFFVFHCEIEKTRSMQSYHPFHNSNNFLSSSHKCIHSVCR